MRKWLLTLGDFESEIGTIALAKWDGKSLIVERLKDYQFPLDRSVYGKGFTGAKIHEGTLFICGYNAVYTIDLNTISEYGDRRRELNQERRKARKIRKAFYKQEYRRKLELLKKRCFNIQPWLVRDNFNDLHNLAFSKNSNGEVLVWIANTGHDSVECYNFDGMKLSTTKLKPQPGAFRNEPSDPYFDSPDTPIYCKKLYDKVHPNAISPCSSKILVSRFSDKSFTSLNGKTVCSLPSPPHDLSTWNNELWTTTTNGQVWRLRDTMDQYEPELVIDTFTSTGRSGWCRGLAVHDEVLVVGLTRIDRMPRERWTNRPFSTTVTGIIVIDRSTNTEIAFSNLEWLGTHPKLFAIVPFEGIQK